MSTPATDAAAREAWRVHLQLFLRSRLRTPRFGVAVRGEPLAMVPSMIPNTQYLLDGVGWALRDHPLEWQLEGWRAIQGFVRDAVMYYTELREEMEGVAAKLSSTSSSSSASATTSSSLTTARADRERTYRSHAAVQDVYLAFCAVDVVVKEVASGVPALRAAVEKDLPTLVSQSFPIFDRRPHAEWLSDAVDEFRISYLHVLRSWVVLRAITDDCVRRLEAAIRHRMKMSREAVEGGAEAQVSRAHIHEGLRALMAATTGTNNNNNTTTSTSHDGVGTSSSTSAWSPEIADRSVRSFVNFIFPSRRGAFNRLRCAHCGLVLNDDAAKKAHYRFHFHHHNFFRREETIVRLLQPSATDFAEHTGDVEKSGYFLCPISGLAEAYRNGAKGQVKVQLRSEAAARKPSSTSP